MRCLMKFLALLIMLSAGAACSNQQSEVAVQNEHEEMEREQVRQQYPELFQEINRLIFEADPIGINFGHNTDEYEPEVGTIIPRLKSCESPSDVRKVIHEEFVRWFDAEMAGSESNYEELAERVWEIWQKHESE